MSFLAKKPKWDSLFDGKTLNGWKVGESATSFKLEDGEIVVNGPVGHLFYDGAVGIMISKILSLRPK